tara:strand:+ start:1384 stop:2073 length:690 start_codon:yes stop_codon:yes gene_type:complete
MRSKIKRKNKKTKRRVSKKNKRNKKKKSGKRKYKLMKGGSLAGNFFRFLAGEDERDRLRVKELKELDEYKKQKKKEAEQELNQEVSENNERLSREQDEESENYKNSIDIIDGIKDLNEGLSENKQLNVLRGGGMLDKINAEQKNLFDTWYSGSTNAYNKLVNSVDPKGEENVNWERKIINGNPMHLPKNEEKVEIEYDQKNCPMSGGKRRKRRSRKKRRRKKRRSRKRR